MKRMLLGLVVMLASWSAANAQTTVTGNVWRVQNNAPATVFFMFPAEEGSNVVSIEMGCSDSAVNHNWIFVAEQGPLGTTTYPIQTTVTCNESSGSYGTTFAATLANPITINTADHTITINGAAWSAVRATGRSGYYWKASGGSANITVN